MKRYECVQVNHHKEIGKIIEQYIADGWILHTYQVAGYGTAFNHYLLFEKGDTDL